MLLANTVWVKKIPSRSSGIFPKRLGIFWLSFTCLLYVTIYTKEQLCIELSANLTKLCHIMRDHPVHIVCAKCSSSAETHAGIFCHFSKQLGIFSPTFTRLLHVSIYTRIQLFTSLSSTVTKLCHVKCDHSACVSANGGHFEHMMVVTHNFRHSWR